jgi:hypothetical protein
MNKVNPESSAKFVQISLPKDFVDFLRIKAEESHRSPPGQVTHWAKIADAIEKILPVGVVNRIKEAREPEEILRVLSEAVKRSR